MNGEKKGPTEIWTRIAGFRVLSANHYTMGPLFLLSHISILTSFQLFLNKHNNIKGLFNSQNSLLSNPTYPSLKIHSVASQSPYPNTVSTLAIGSQSMNSFPLGLHTNLSINPFQHPNPKWVWQLLPVCWYTMDLIYRMSQTKSKVLTLYLIYPWFMFLSLTVLW